MNWRDHFEEYIKSGQGKVLDVCMNKYGVPVAVAIEHGTGKIIATNETHMLAPKEHKKLFRPWRPDEVPVGKVVISNGVESPLRFMITGVDGRGHVFLGKDSYSPDQMLEYYLCDGLPCGKPA